MIPILYSNVEEALGGTWTEKKDTFQKNYYWNCETDTAVLTSYSGNYTAYAAIAVTPGKLYHVHAVRGTSSKSRVLLFVKSDYTILWKLEASSSPVDRDVIAPANAAYALITAGTKNDTYLNNTEFKEFSTGGAITNGLGRLSDCISCLVTEERNGKYEVEFTYPVSGIHYEDIQKGRAITVTHDETGAKQPFVIYRISAPINGIVTINAHHMSYDLSNAIVEPFTATSVADVFDQFVTKCIIPNPYTFWTDNTTAGTFNAEVPDSVRAYLGGQRGSILDVFGGEYEFDGYTVRNYVSRGSDNGVTIRYGKNLKDIEDVTDDSGTYNAVVPYWSDGQGTVISGGLIAATGATEIKAVSLDLSTEWEAAPAVSDLETKAAAYLSANQPWIPKQNITIDFVALWQTEEYKNIAPLERVKLCDTVHVIHPGMNIDVSAKVIKVVWNALADKYDSIELGEAKSTFADTLVTKVDLDTTLKTYARTSFLSEAIDHATQLITGGLGGYIVFTYNANGEPTEMLIMNTPDIETATKVMRFNNEGIGYSTTGYQGPFTSAWTLSDGAFVADFITAGTMSANRIQGGTLTLGGADNGNGVLRVYDGSNPPVEIGSWTRTGITLNRGKLTSADGNTYFDLTNSELRCSSLFSPEPTGEQNPTAAVLTGNSTGSGQTSNFVFYSELGGKSRGLYIVPTVVDNHPSEIKSTEGINIHAGNVSLEIAMDSQTGNLAVNQARLKNTGGSAVSIGPYGVSIGRGQYSVDCDSRYGICLNNLPYSTAGDSCIGYDMASPFYGQLCYFFKSTISSKRYKHDIKALTDEALDPERLYKVEIKQFVLNDKYAPEGCERRGKTLVGFIAEELDEIYPIAVNHDKEGQATSWEPAYIIPGMLALIQEQKKQLDAQEKRIKALEKKFDLLMEALEEDG